MIVTDKRFYLDNALKDMVDLCIQRKDKKWDNLLVIDGMERSGKTKLATTIGYYYSHATGKPFSVDNVFFDPEKLMEAATQTRQQCLIWDEAAFGGLSTQWQSRIQQKMNAVLMTTGKYEHLYIVIVPSFFRLNRYLAIDRSIGLLHVYTPDLVTRGFFTCLNMQEKTWIYNNNRKSETYGKNISFRGKFTLKNTEGLIDEAAYENKKDEAIANFVRSENPDTWKLKLQELQFRISMMLDTKQAATVANVNDSTVRRWRFAGKALGFEV